MPNETSTLDAKSLLSRITKNEKNKTIHLYTLIEFY